MTLTRFGFHFSSTTYGGWTSGGLFPIIRDVAQAAEQSGFDSLWVPDHTQQNEAHKTNAADNATAPMIEAYTLLTALAGVTSDVRLGALATPVSFRNPAMIAKAITSLDVISGGRAVLGLGTGWDADEHTAYGIPFPTDADERAARLEEALHIFRAMEAVGPASFAGEFYTIDRAFNSPPAVQHRIPVVVAGGGERLTLALVARYADACNFFGSPADISRKFDVLRDHCQRVGRNYSEITKTVGFVPPDDTDELCRMVEQRQALGADGIILFAVSSPLAGQVRKWGEALTTTFA